MVRSCAAEGWRAVKNFTLIKSCDSASTLEHFVNDQVNFDVMYAGERG